MTEYKRSAMEVSRQATQHIAGAIGLGAAIDYIQSIGY